jgi:uncharacterized protein (TIGR00297 family)
MVADWQVLTSLSIGVALLALLTEGMARRGRWPLWVSRKILHVGAIGACALAPLWLGDLWALTAVVALAGIALLFLVVSGKLPGEAGGRRPWGIVLFPLAFLVLLLRDPYQAGQVNFPMLILALSDAAAAVAGKLLAKRWYNLTGDRKSLVGSTTFFAVTVLLGFYNLENTLAAVRFYSDPVVSGWFYAIFIASMLTALEALGSRGTDNLLIPLAAAFLLERHAFYVPRFDPLLLLLGLVFAVLFVKYTVRRGALTPGGALTAAVLGLWVLTFAGWEWLFPLFFFFGTSTAMGRLARGRADRAEAKHGRARDHWQVLCNGGIFGLVATDMPHNFLHGPGLVAAAMAFTMAVSTADTWSSELGIYFRGKTYDVLRWRPLPVGVSGGVSGPGTLAGLVGAAVMALLCDFISDGKLDPLFWGLVTLTGFGGMLLDSVLGAGWQAKYRKPGEGEIVEEPDASAPLVSGLRWLDNDAVNLVSNAVATGLAAGLVFSVFY